MNQETTEIISAVPASVAVIVSVAAVAGVILLAQKLLSDKYRWEPAFRDLLIDNLGDRK